MYRNVDSCLEENCSWLHECTEKTGGKDMRNWILRQEIVQTQRHTPSSAVASGHVKFVQHVQSWYMSHRDVYGWEGSYAASQHWKLGGFATRWCHDGLKHTGCRNLLWKRKKRKSNEKECDQISLMSSQCKVRIWGWGQQGCTSWLHLIGQMLTCVCFWISSRTIMVVHQNAFMKNSRNDPYESSFYTDNILFKCFSDVWRCSKSNHNMRSFD